MMGLLLDDEMSYSVIINRFDKYQRANAIDRIDNEKALIRIAKNDPVDFVVMLAIKKIHDQKVLKDFTSHNFNDRIRRCAVLNIIDEEFLFNITRTDYSLPLRNDAVESIRNQEILSHIIVNENFSISARRNAIRNIIDEDKLIYFALKYKSLRSEAVENPYLKDEETLIEFAKYDDSWAVRLAALKKLNNQELFVDVAFHDNYLRSYAASQINSKNVLRELIKKYNVGNARFEEISKMSRYRQMQLIRNEK